jgi:hypothetical protein
MMMQYAPIERLNFAGEDICEATPPRGKFEAAYAAEKASVCHFS